MKKFYLTLSVVVASFGLAIGQACVIDQNNTEFFAPAPELFPCIERTVLFGEPIQLSIPGTFTTPLGTITIDSVVISGITGFPTGLSYACNPASCSFPGGSNGCINIQGTTSDAAADYTLTFQGTAYINTPLGAQAVALSQLAGFGGPSPSYDVTVIEPGAECRPAPNSIKGFSAELNSAMNIFPNPNNGVFEFRLNASRRVNGEVLVVDVTGRKVFAQSLDVTGLYSTTIDLSTFSKGIYTVQLRTAEGFASKTVSVE